MNFPTERLQRLPEIETARLFLRIFTPEDLNELAAIFARPVVTRHLGVAGETLSRAETEGVIASMLNHWLRHGIGRWAVVHKEHGRLIGYGGLRWFEYDGEGSGKPELVYLLDEPYWGDGLATEVAWASLEYGFVGRGFEQIVAMTKPANTASRHILEKKLGLRYLGEQRFFDIDVMQYSLARAEYRPDNSRYQPLRRRPVKQ